jgi:hypothetical protein
MTDRKAHLGIAALCALLAWAPAGAHDFWIEPGAFAVPVHQGVNVGLLVGEHFQGEPFARDGRRIVDFAAYGPGGRTPVVGLEGRHPAGIWRPAQGGTHILSYRSNRAHAELSREKFATYLGEQGLETIAAQLSPQAGQIREAYSRYAKALVGVDGAANLSDDRRLGLPFEIVADGDAFRVWFHDTPLANVLVIALSQDGGRRLTARTDAQGRATLALQPGSWLVTAVHMIAAPADADAQWESFWGSLRFTLLVSLPRHSSRVLTHSGVGTDDAATGRTRRYA